MYMFKNIIIFAMLMLLHTLYTSCFVADSISYCDKLID